MPHFMKQPDPSDSFFPGGLFLHSDTFPTSLISLFPSSSSKSSTVSCFSWGPTSTTKVVSLFSGIGGGGGDFLSLSLSFNSRSNEDHQKYGRESRENVEQHEKKKKKKKKKKVYEEEEEKENNNNVGLVSHGSGAINMTKHLWAGAVAAMVSRTFVAPLERLKLEYIVRGEQRNIFELIQAIATSQGLRGFWKGNFVNILRTAPFKAINFYAYDTYRNKLTRMMGNEESTNFERFVAGAAAGITATLLCLPMDTIRTVMVAPGGEALGGIIGAFRHMIKTEGFFSLYKGLVPSIISMAPSGAVFYGVYDILKTSYLHSPEGMKRIKHMKEEDQGLNALEQLELGPLRTLLYGAIAGCCAEAATYPFEVVRRQLQMQVHATRMNAMATCVKIVEQGGVPALYTGLVPSLLQVLPSAAISYLVYEFMKIVLKVESS
ncbi:hypothetical protein Lal_00050125 [Lupinus albus]|uniref:Putative mitochondrial carrier protein n=1 Tax=Lupinus albus TaxID=3870 RepID=A0A6A5MAI8_LUPAL|nr:putative mitochondrial carrier protein [Lupinus albus]KAF1867692.1 hypothetical protein Lal_00050125 [Lupinus albus]